ncbi:MAG: DUF2442 domain-containing protein [Alphaproteobacteria bacterium]|nr:DUF2442 domain-containing protein [Alphaproteobacteria bacterium]
MSISVELDDRVADVRVTDEALEVRLRDGRRISAPLTWFPRLARATPSQRAKWELAAAGHGVHWPDIDEDLSVAGLLRAAS